MGRNRKPQPKKHWPDKALTGAIEERRTLRTPARVLEQKYNVPKSTIDRHLNGNPQKQGRKPVCKFYFYFSFICPYLVSTIFISINN